MEKRSFFQLAPGSILGIPINSNRSQYALCEGCLDKIDHIHIYRAAKVDIFCCGSLWVWFWIFVVNCVVIVSNSMTLETKPGHTVTLHGCIHIYLASTKNQLVITSPLSLCTPTSTTTTGSTHILEIQGQGHYWVQYDAIMLWMKV